MLDQNQHEIEIEVGDQSFQKSSPFSYSSIQIETGFRPIGFRFFKYITEIRAKLGTHEIFVCGESNDDEVSWQKAFSELYERSALVAFGSTFGATTSNGWAAHPNREHARLNTILELVERDAFLAHWYSKTPFVEIPKNEFPLDIQAWVVTELSRSEFPNLRILLSTIGLGPSVTCLLTNKDGFGVCAHSTKESFTESISSAIAEACRAAHSSLRREHWKDTLKLKNHEPGLVNPGAHGLYYAYHEPFPKWMFGERRSLAKEKQNWQPRINGCISDNRFAFQEVMSDPAIVGFAKHPSAFELRWETTQAQSVLSHKSFDRLSMNPEFINLKPHIVS